MRKLLIAAVGCGALLSSAARADNDKSCTFLWPLATEIAYFEADTSEAAETSAKLATVPQDKAIALALKPMSDVDLPSKPTSTPKPDDAKKFAGYVTIEAFPAPGIYQVAISESGWLDVIQSGKTLEAIAHTGSHDCKKLRKSVRFEIGEGPVSIQVSGVPSNSIKIAIRPGAD